MKAISVGLLLFASFNVLSGTIVLNGKTYTGTNIIVNSGADNNVIIDGKIASVSESPEINIQVTGDINTLKVTACNICVVHGNVGSVESTSGDVQVRNVSGNVSTVSGAVHATQISGNVNTISGNITR